MTDAAPSVGILVAFSAGLLSFLSPCVLPLIPSYLTFITGLTLDEVQSAKPSARRTAMIHAVLFVVGFTLIFLALGATATLLGRVLHAYRDWLTRIGGVLIIVFGLYMLGVFNIALFSRDRRMHLAEKPVGYLGTVLVGMAFGAGWTPCIGPILGSILLYTSSQADLGHGFGLLSAYSFGLAVPFLLSAVAVDRFLDTLKRLRRQMVWITRASGALMILVGVLMVTDQFTVIASQLQALTPAALRGRL